MYNTDFPDRDDLPTPARLVRSTIMAGVSALVILVTIVLPSEYGIDPTRVGSILGLTPMGEIKVQLAQEAAAQAATPPVAAVAVSTAAVPALSISPDALRELDQRLAAVETVVGPVNEPFQAPIADVKPLENTLPDVEPEPAPSAWKDEVKFTLTPGQGTEYKLVMATGATAAYEFVADGGTINFDAHGEGTGQKVSYQNGCG